MTADKDPCEVCKKEEAITIPSSFDGIHQNCPRCGEFKISGSACGVIRAAQGNEKRAALSGWIREQFRSGSVPLITTYTLETVLSRPAPPVMDRAMALLSEAEHQQRYLGDRFNVKESRFLAASYSYDRREVDYLLKVLEEQGLARFVAMGGESEILPAGYVRLDELRSRNVSSAHGFVAMSFHEDLDKIYETGFSVALFDAGYDPVRMDRVEHVNRIDDEIIRRINASRFVVADFTGHRGGVYFEAGYALGIGVPVFWTCRRSDMAELHFDIRQFNCIGWDEPEDLAARLSTRIEAVLGVGPKGSKK